MAAEKLKPFDGDAAAADSLGFPVRVAGVG
jgi:hypothetical protein